MTAAAPRPFATQPAAAQSAARRGRRLAPLLAAAMTAAFAAPPPAEAQSRTGSDAATVQALKAMFEGPEAKFLRVGRHEFHVKPARRERTRTGATVLRGQISHHLTGRRDEQIYYAVRVEGRTIRQISIQVDRGGRPAALSVQPIQAVMGGFVGELPIPPRPLWSVGGSLNRLVDGSWEGSARYLVGHAAVRLADEGREAAIVTPPTTDEDPTTIYDPPAPQPLPYFFGAALSETILRQPIYERRQADSRQRIQPRSYDRGVRINSVTPNSPAAAAGLEPGDVLVEANSRPLESLALFDLAMAQSRGTLNLKVVNVRTGGIVPLTVQVDRQFTRSGSVRR